MSLTEKERIYKNVWCCAFQRRYEAKVKENWDLYHREQQTLLMCLKMVKWIKFDSEKKSNYMIDRSYQ